MINVYIGKQSTKGSGQAICKVLDSDKSTGDVIVYNRETNKIETLRLEEKQKLPENIEKLASDTENEYIHKERALLKIIK